MDWWDSHSECDRYSKIKLSIIDMDGFVTNLISVKNDIFTCDYWNMSTSLGNSKGNISGSLRLGSAQIDAAVKKGMRTRSPGRKDRGPGII